MDSKNVIMAVILSTLVLVGWGVFFEGPIVEQNPSEEKVLTDENTTPSIDKTKTSEKISRNETINKVKRIKLEKRR